MSWSSALRRITPTQQFNRPPVPQHKVDWSRLVSLDFETYYDDDYTLKKLSTSEYVRDPRFKAQMLGIKVGHGKTRIIPPNRIKSELAKYNWSTHAILAHHAQFDGLILSHHYGVHPAFIYDSMSMARGLHSNDIGAGLDEASIYYGGQGKIEGSLELTKGVRNWDKATFAKTGIYCTNDVEEMFRIFCLMLPKMPDDEIGLIDLTCRAFTSPVLRVDRPRVEAELKRELDRRDVLFASVLDPHEYQEKVTLSRTEKLLPAKELDTLIVKRVLGSSEKFADLLRAEGVEPPKKISPAWMKKNAAERLLQADKKYAYAFAKDDLEFTDLPNRVETWGLDLENPDDVALTVIKQKRLQNLVDCRLAVKSTSNVTRSERFLSASENGMLLPVYYAYFRAHTGRWGGGDKRNMQNLERDGELRQSILAPEGHSLCVADSSQIEARVNGWLWGQHDLLDAFRDADAGTGRDAYCLFGDSVYGREITKADKMERFVGKVCVLGLGFQMGAPKFQNTLAKGALGGPPVYFGLEQCKGIVNTYRYKNNKIVAGWEICKGIIEDMAAGIKGSWGPINWEHETIWLPNGMALRYPGLHKSIDPETGWDQWSYQAKEQRKKLYGGLLCLGADTEVLTDNGWRPIIEVRLCDNLWDGLNWVSHSGLIYQGQKETIDFGGVVMTPDHEVLVGYEWREARNTTHHEATSSFAGSYRHPFRHDASYYADRERRPQNALDDSVRLRGNANNVGLGVPQRQHKELRLFDSATSVQSKNDARDVQTSGVLSLAQYAGPLQTAYTSVMGTLRRAWNNSVRGMERLRQLLGGHASRLRTWAGAGSQRQLAGVQSGELPLDNVQSEQSKSTIREAYPNAPRPHATLASLGAFWNQEHDSLVSQARSVADSTYVQQTGRTKQDVYDLIDAGPLCRFTIRGADGRPFLVHNCENVVQALARIIVAWQMLQIDKKYRVVMTTHDEVVATVKTAQAQRCFEFMSKWMSTPPPWCLDIPLSCEGRHAANYSK